MTEENPSPLRHPDTSRQLARGNIQRRRMKKSIFLLSIFVLSGCAAGVKPITTPDGKRGFVVTCDGSADDWSTCYNAASNACGGKYGIVDRNETSTPTAYGPMVRRQIVAECK